MASVLLACSGASQVARDEPPQLRITVPVTPSPVAVAGQRHLAWELFITNNLDAPVRATRLTVVDEVGQPILDLDSAGIAERFDVVRHDPIEPTTIGSGETGVIYLWHTLSEAVPSALNHQLTFEGVGGDEVRTVTSPVASDPPVVLSPPVLGQGWFCANAPANDSRHRRSIQVLEDGLYTAQRYAIDLVRALGGGTHDGNPAANSSYHAYGAELLAVAAGTVIEVRDGIPENVPGAESHAVEITYDTLAGNYVVLGIGAERYVVYAHLQPGSLRVAPGDTVAAGQVLGLLGNSGNSSEPHLHLHVCDAPSALACHGRPYAFSSFVQVPLAEVAPGEYRPGAPRMVQSEIPMERGYLIFTPPQ